MQIRFADRRPAGDYALVVPVAGKDRAALDTLGADRVGVEAALARQRFDGDASTVAEHFLSADSGVRLVTAQSRSRRPRSWAGRRSRDC